MGNSSIDISLANIWRNWFKIRSGKRSTAELETFDYFLEKNLAELYSDLNSGRYKHGDYKKFIVTDTKRREVSVADIRDRIVHRLLYEYLSSIYDKTFIYDAWSCRKEKGLLGAIERTKKFLKRYRNSFIWRADIQKFFDNVDQEILLTILSRRIKGRTAFNLLQKVITSFTSTASAARERERESKNAPRCSEALAGRREKGMPIGNLTSQIFANIYLNELDRFVKYSLKPQAYLRYGDDFIIISKNLKSLSEAREKVIVFLKDKLHLEINAKNDIIIKPRWGLKFLGVELFPEGRRLNKRNRLRVLNRFNRANIGSYIGLVRAHGKKKAIKEFNWAILEKLNDNF